MRLRRIALLILGVAICAGWGTADAAAQVYSVQTAFYGNARSQADVTARVRQLSNGPDFQVNSRTMGVDPAPRQPKGLTIVGISQSGTRTFTYQDGQMVSARMFSGPPLSAAPGRPGGGYPGGGYPGGGYGSLRIFQANYGPGGRRGADVTRQLQNMVRNDRIDIVVNNSTMGGDPAVGQPKILRVTYEFKGRRRDTTVPENSRLRLP